MAIMLVLSEGGMLGELEDALQYHILGSLCFHDLQALRCVSKSYLSLIESDAIWHVLLESLHYWKGVNTRALRSPSAKEVYTSLVPLCSSHRWFPAIRAACTKWDVARVSLEALHFINDICEGVTRRCVTLACGLKDGTLCEIGELPMAPQSIIAPRLSGSYTVDLQLAVKLLIPPPLLQAAIEMTATYVVSCGLNDSAVADAARLRMLRECRAYDVIYRAIARYLPPGYACTGHEGVVLLCAAITHLITTFVQGAQGVSGGREGLRASGCRRFIGQCKPLYSLLRGEVIVARVPALEEALTLSWTSVDCTTLQRHKWREAGLGVMRFEMRMQEAVRQLRPDVAQAVRGLVRQVQQGVEASGRVPPVQYDHFIRMLVCLRRGRRDWTSGVGAGRRAEEGNPQLVDVAVAASLLGLKSPILHPPRGPGETAGRLEANRETVWVASLVLRDVDGCEGVSSQVMGRARFYAFSALELAVMHGRTKAAHTLLRHGVPLDAGDEVWKLYADDEDAHPPRRPLSSCVKRRDAAMLSLLLDHYPLTPDLTRSADFAVAAEAAILLRDLPCLALLLRRPPVGLEDSVALRLAKKAGWSGDWDVVRQVLHSLIDTPLDLSPDRPVSVATDVGRLCVAEALRGTLFLQHYPLAFQLWGALRMHEWTLSQHDSEIGTMGQLVRLASEEAN